jgi:uncharacterized PurR-regulated membrane protein YhhQ (DUF165 family)
MVTKLVCVAYVGAMLLANLLVAQFGPAISPVLAFFLIGLDLSVRDFLHIKLRTREMLGLIFVSGALTYILNPAAGMIAVASACAFTGAALVDWAVFSKLADKTWMTRSNASNVAGAAVDSLLFPTIAFGALMPHIVAMQFVAKVAGGAVWTWLLGRWIKPLEAIVPAIPTKT